MAEENIPYPVIDVTNWRVERQETIGADEKYWLSEPSSRDLWLFKANIEHVHPKSGDKWSQREDVSEKVAGEIARRFGIPCASIALATWRGKSGCISRNLLPEGWELQTGLVRGELDRGIRRWALKGTAWRFEHDEPPGPPTLVELAGHALRMVRPKVRSWWLEHLEAVTPQDVFQVTSRMPKMSYPASMFIEQVFETNRRRVLDDC
jgi:hypothetical protein